MGDGGYGDHKRRVVADWAAEAVISLSSRIFLSPLGRYIFVRMSDQELRQTWRYRKQRRATA